MLLDHVNIVRMLCIYACNESTMYVQYIHINIYLKNSAIEVTSVRLDHGHPD